MQHEIDLLRFSVAQGRRDIVNAGPDMINAILDNIARRVEVVADAAAKADAIRGADCKVYIGHVPPRPIPQPRRP